MRKIRKPFLVINPKSYSYGEELVKLAKFADELSIKHDIDCLFTAQAVDLRLIKENTENLIICAQHLDGITVGRGMGHVLPEALVDAGVEATFLNHAECQKSFNELSSAVSRAKECGIMTIICANTINDAKVLATLEPTIMVCELNELIGTGITADASYMVKTNEAVKSVSADTLVLQAAGISSGKDVYDAIATGADGSGGTSGIMAAKDKFAVVEDMFIELVKAREDFK